VRRPLISAASTGSRARRSTNGRPSTELEVSDAKRLKALEDENAKLKKLLAEAMLDMAMLKNVAAKNGDARRKARGRLRSFAQQFRCERRRACGALAWADAL
jgi:predicted  nucleic acid-binding Zn-ribbon protein